ncbi:MAG: ABC transporter permease subunit [Myxococcota bacterium]|nr:ABC transporter permease subunit [Myxococcota bacterium]
MRHSLIVAWFDLRESLRSRRALALMVIYMIGSMAATGLFVVLLAEVESAVASSLSVSQTARPGAMTEALMESEELLSIISGLIGSEDLAREVVSIPPIALFYGWLSLTFVPLLVAFTSAEAVSSELASGSARFVLFRSSRLSWATGKLGGQTLLMATGILLGSVGVWIIGYGSLGSFQPATTAVWLLKLSGRSCIYGFTFLGITLGISQITSSLNGSRTLALLTVIALGIGGGLSGSEDVQSYAPVLISSIHPLFPNAHRIDLWRPDLISRLPAICMLLTMGIAGFGIGNLIMTQRDA